MRTILSLGFFLGAVALVASMAGTAATTTLTAGLAHHTQALDAAANSR